jgi:hypothetical protein
MEKLNEKSTSKAQQRLMGQAYAYKKGDLKKKDLNPEYADKIIKLSNSMSLKKLKDFASTKHDKLVDKVKESKLILTYESFLNKNKSDKYNYYYDFYTKKIKNNKDLNILIYLNMRSDFIEAVYDSIDSFGNNEELPTDIFYSNLCKTDRNPKADFNGISEIMNFKHDFDIKTIKEIFNKDVDSLLGFDIINLFKNEDSIRISNHIRTNISEENIEEANNILSKNIIRNNLSQLNGLTDLYFYMLAEELGYENEEIGLGGEGWVYYDQIDSDDQNEAFIRYKYGYHRTDYGKLFLKQANKSEEEFKKDALVYIEEYLVENITDYIIKYRTNYSNMYHIIKNNKENIIIKEDNRLMIDLFYISKIVEKEINKKININEMFSYLKKNLVILNIDIEEIDGYLIMWENF